MAAGHGGPACQDWWAGAVSPAGFVARPDTWAAAGQETNSASESLAAVTGRLCHVLADCWGAWGNDNIGLAFCNGSDGKAGFGRAADNLLTALAQMVNLLAQTGWGLEVSGARYKAADKASTIGARTPAAVHIPRPATYSLPTVSRRLVPSDPPPPEWEFLLQLLARMVAGTEYPEGNFGALGTIVSELNGAGNAISQLAEAVQRAAGSVTSANAGSARDQFGSFAKGLVGGLGGLASQCKALAASAENLLRQKHAARIEFWASLAFLAVMFAAAQALAFFSFGASEGGFLAAVVGQGIGLRAMLLFVLRMVIEGILFSAGDDLIDQLARMHEGLQHGFSEDEFWVAVGTGAVASLVTLGLGSALHAGAGASGALETVAEWSQTEAADTLATKARGVATRMVVNGLNGTVGNVAGQAIFDDGHINLAQAAEGGFNMAVLGEATEAGNRWVLGRAAAGNAGPATSADIPSAISEARPSDIKAALNPGSPVDHNPSAAGQEILTGGRDSAAADATAVALPASKPVAHGTDLAATGVARTVPTDSGGPADAPLRAGAAADAGGRGSAADAVTRAPAAADLSASVRGDAPQAGGALGGNADDAAGHGGGLSADGASGARDATTDASAPTPERPGDPGVAAPRSDAGTPFRPDGPAASGHPADGDGLADGTGTSDRTDSPGAARIAGDGGGADASRAAGDSRVADASRTADLGQDSGSAGLADSDGPGREAAQVAVAAAPPETGLVPGASRDILHGRAPADSSDRSAGNDPVPAAAAAGPAVIPPARAGIADPVGLSGDSRPAVLDPAGSGTVASSAPADAVGRAAERQAAPADTAGTDGTARGTRAGEQTVNAVRSDDAARAERGTREAPRLTPGATASTGPRRTAQCVQMGIQPRSAAMIALTTALSKMACLDTTATPLPPTRDRSIPDRWTTTRRSRSSPSGTTSPIARKPRRIVRAPRHARSYSSTRSSAPSAAFSPATPTTGCSRAGNRCSRVSRGHGRAPTSTWSV